MQLFRKFKGLIDLRDLIVLGGAASFIFGVAQIYPPFAWIVFGSVLIAIGMRK